MTRAQNKRCQYLRSLTKTTSKIVIEKAIWYDENDKQLCEVTTIVTQKRGESETYRIVRMTLPDGEELIP